MHGETDVGGGMAGLYSSALISTSLNKCVRECAVHLLDTRVHARSASYALPRARRVFSRYSPPSSSITWWTSSRGNVRGMGKSLRVVGLDCPKARR